MIASGLIGYSQQKQEAKQALSEIQGQYSELIESSTDAQGIPKRIEKPINTTPKARGEFGEMERFMKEFMDQMASQRNDYLLELEAIGWNSILDANRIKADKTFVESKVTIQKAKEVVAKYTKRTQSLLEDAKNNIRSLNISDSSKSSMLSGFDRGMEKAKANIDAMWSLEAKTIREFENIITLLSSKKGAWVVDGEQILFYNDNDLERFNSYIASIQNIAQQQESIQRQSVQTVNQNFDRIKEMK
jgi:DNA-binding ferritin-like protein